MAIKVENHATIAVKKLDEEVQRVVECVPVEHLRGLARVVFVDRIEDAQKVRALMSQVDPGPAQ